MLYLSKKLRDAHIYFSPTISAGALLFWPAGIFFPVAMYLAAVRPRPAVRRFLKTLCGSLLFVSIAIVGASVHSLATKIFSSS